MSNVSIIGTNDPYLYKKNRKKNMNSFKKFKTSRNKFIFSNLFYWLVYWLDLSAFRLSAT